METRLAGRTPAKKTDKIDIPTLRRRLHIWFAVVVTVKITSFIIAYPFMATQTAVVVAASFAIETVGLAVGIILVGRIASRIPEETA